MASELSEELRAYLRHCGLARSKVAQCSASTRMYHDLGLYGDVAEACMEELANRYHVDLEGFEFEKYFPREFAGDGALARTLLWILPLVGSAARQAHKYTPLSLETIERVMRSKRWD